MADIKYYDVILKPVITEKSMNAMGDRKYTFMVQACLFLKSESRPPLSAALP